MHTTTVILLLVTNSSRNAMSFSELLTLQNVVVTGDLHKIKVTQNLRVCICHSEPCVISSATISL